MVPKGKFSKAVRNIVPMVPSGSVATYAQIASLASSCKAARSVANAMGTPGCTCGWHRVVTSSGKLSSSMPDKYRAKQRALLEADGIEFDGWRIVGFRARQWDPP